MRRSWRETSREVVEDRKTILVLVDENGRGRQPARSRELMKSLCSFVKPILVAQRYKKPAWTIFPTPWIEEFYAFPALNYNTHVKRWASELVARHAPDWVLVYGWENTQLILEVSELDVPIVIYIDYLSAISDAVAQLDWAAFFVDAILLSEEILQAVKMMFCEKDREKPKTLSKKSRVFASYRKKGHPKETLKRILRSNVGVEQPSCIAKRLVDVGQQTIIEHARLREQLLRDQVTIQAANVFNPELSSPRSAGEQDDKSVAIARYLRMSRRVAPQDSDSIGPILRRPVEGFHPLIYATDHPDFNHANEEDPLAHFLRQGRPSGRWTHQIIGARPDAIPRSNFRAALHAHMHYTDLLPELLERLSSNKAQVDLFITTTSDARREEIAEILRQADVNPAMLVSEPSNLGRDIWPFIKLLGSGAFATYDAVGHMHGKRSPSFEDGDIWRDFLWRHLIGSPEAMMDSILHRFEHESGLGLVIAEDPHLEGWGRNKATATELAEKMGVALPLPTYFEFPIGTMFWARPAAMAPLLDLGLTADMIPPEPLPQDGTLLHALERLIPFAAEKAGFRTAATYVAGCVR